jgi:UDP-N-acetylmuramoyl-tripeptide--D-alanyl-D-alanine ligase
MNIKKIYSIFKEYPTICTNSRDIKDSSIFFALKGEKFNGNEYATKAIKEGCVYSIVDEKEYSNHPNTILVANTLETLQELASYHRKQLAIPII